MTNNLISKAKSATPFKIARTSKTGKLSKKAKTFLEMCKTQFGFEPAREFIEHYSREMTLYQELWLRYSSDVDRQNMSQQDIEAFWRMHDALKDSLKTFMKYSYPTMRATQVKGSGGPAPVFNINLGAPEKSKSKTINVTPKDV